MTATFVNTVDGIREERPTTGEIVRARFSDISGGDRTLIAPGQEQVIARLNACRERSRELLVPLIIECLDALDEASPGATLGTIPLRDLPEVFVPFEEDDIQILQTHPRPFEQLVGYLRSCMYQTILSHVHTFLHNRGTERDERVFELARLRDTFLQHFPEHGRRSPYIQTVELFASGFGTANDMAWDIAYSTPIAYQRQFGKGMDIEELAGVIERAQGMCEPLANMHQHDFVALTEKMKRGRPVPKVESMYAEMPIADPRYFWLSTNGSDLHNVELAEDAFPTLLTPRVIAGFTCPGKGKGIQRILRRTAAVCRQFVGPHMDAINAEITEDLRAERGEA